MRRRKKGNGKEIFMVVCGALLLLVAILIIKTMTYSFRDNKVVQTDVPVNVPPVSEKSIKRFAGGIQIPTISVENYAETDFQPFDRFKTYLEQSYPEVYDKLETMVINDYGLVFHWKGKNSQLDPILLLSHYDVVPVDGYEEEQYFTGDTIFRFNETPLSPIDSIQEGWTYPPFSGAVTGGRIYGRGTLDMKGMLFGIMEAADALLQEGFQPERDIWFAFGQDEENGGRQGAVRIAEYFKERNLRFDAVYDEGSFVLAPGVGGINKPMALVGVGEKGFLTLRLSIRGLGGHSSMPPKRSSLVMAAEIIEKLNNNQMPARIISPIQSFLNNAGGEMGFASRLAIANQWLLRPVLLKTLGNSPATNALIRTTTAFTVIKGSDANNVVSAVSELTINFRILPGEQVEDVIRHVKEICKEYDIEYEVVNAREPSAISPEDTRAFTIIEENVRELYPDAIFSSYITIGGTDAYKYQIVSDHIYRFMPIYLNDYEQRTIHNENEHISFENFGRMIQYFKLVMTHYDK
ncbi:MAG: M20/M25/M40 family metallo-hydrolase [Tannerellaceae bacterium]|nr:M20/M25/M40 family metallo-hydrolase [Tannerellaceae bacterium]